MNHTDVSFQQHRGPARLQLARELKSAYENGASIRALHEKTRLSYGKVHRLLNEVGTTFRPRGGHRPHPPK